LITGEVHYGFCLDSNTNNFFWILSGLCQFSGSGGKIMENLIGGIIALAMIVYLFLVLLRPEKF
jgi:K+-transporting ATPase KdpF subunit